MRTRARLALVLAVAALAALLACNPPPAGIEIQFGMYPEEFEGLDVEVDGEVVGQLKVRGSRTVTRFIVPEGDHTVRVLHPELECRPRTVTVANRALPVMLLLDFMEAVDEQGRYETVLTLDG